VNDAAAGTTAGPDMLVLAITHVLRPRNGSEGWVNVRSVAGAVERSTWGSACELVCDSFSLHPRLLHFVALPLLASDRQSTVSEPRCPGRVPYRFVETSGDGEMSASVRIDDRVCTPALD